MASKIEYARVLARHIGQMLLIAAVLTCAALGTVQTLQHFGFFTVGTCLDRDLPALLARSCMQAYHFARSENASGQPWFGFALCVVVVLFFIVRDMSGLRLFKAYREPAPRLLAFDDASEAGNVRHVCNVIDVAPRKARKPRATKAKADKPRKASPRYRDPRNGRLVSAATYQQLVRDGIVQPTAQV